MGEGTSSGGQVVQTAENHHGKRDFWGKEAPADPLKKKRRLQKLSDSVHNNAARCSFENCIDVTCNDMQELIRTWKENHWHLPGKFLRLNKKKCENLHSYLEETKKSYTLSACETAVREYLTAVKRAKNLVEESSHKDWLLKAVELWECSEHFVEVSLDLCWSSHIMSFRGRHGVEGCHREAQRHIQYSERPIAQAALTQSCEDKKTLDAMVKATLLDGALKKGSAEHDLALLLEDRLKGQSSWHPPILTSFNFCIRSMFRLFSRGSSKAGASGVVLTFPWVYKKQFAVKMRHPNTNDETSTFKDEFKVLDKYRSPYIVAVVGYWELESWLDTRPWVRNATKCPFLLMEAMECDLQGLITKYRESRRGMQEGFSALETIKIMLPIAKALRFLHEKDVAHRDVKLQNIMCSNVQNIMCSGDFDDAIVKLIDFGEATVGVSKISSKTHRPAGTKGYMDPEMWKLDPKTRKRKGYNLFRADVFSFAMVFVELLTWRLPWGISAREVQDELNNGERPALPNDLPDYVSFIVECCWCVDPTARPTFADICSMLQNAKLLLLDKNIFGNQDDLFCYLDGDCIDRNIGNRAFLH